AELMLHGRVGEVSDVEFRVHSRLPDQRYAPEKTLGLTLGAMACPMLPPNFWGGDRFQYGARPDHRTCGVSRPGAPSVSSSNGRRHGRWAWSRPRACGKNTALHALGRGPLAAHDFTDNRGIYPTDRAQSGRSEVEFSLAASVRTGACSSSAAPAGALRECSAVEALSRLRFHQSSAR